MYLLGKILITATLPDELSRLKDISYNLWWSWNPDAIDLYRDIDLLLWEKVNKNPVRFLQEVSSKKVNEKLGDEDYMIRYKQVVNKYDSYMSNTTSAWFNKAFPDKSDHSVIYFSAEYGLNEVLPVYSGGLGVLSGDHCKSASDLGIPFTAIGLFYKQGYFSQRINREGWQETNFSNLNASQLPVKPALDKDGNQISISVELPGRVVYAIIWKVQIGRVSLYLMDTDVESNNPSDRMLTARLYGGNQETRIQQEIFLGIGGIRTINALGINASVYHMNEGHSSFMGLELIRQLIQDKNLSFKAAKEVVASSTVFTTHTPVPAGNDVFPLPLIDKYFNNYWGELGINRHEFLDLGLKVGDHQNFNMTILALNLSGRKNGVSKLHGAVSRDIYSSVWPGIPKEDIPITHITNGIHTLTWLSPNIKALYDKHLENEWDKKIYEKHVWDKVDDIPDSDLWDVHCFLKNKMIEFVREKIKIQYASNGASPEKINEVEKMLNPDALTIGFARRFATYKRATLLFRNLARIQKIFNRENRPVQIIFAGKAHPADRPAHEVIKHIHDIAKQEGFVGKVVLVENYNMTLARNMVQGVDIWLNNPRRPLEASGTSGQKVCINGILNFSILDGWWCEGYNGKNGWAIGSNMNYDNEELQDNADSESIYNILENQIVPLFYERDEDNIPVKWVKKMKESIKSISYKFSTDRMVQEYTKMMYLPCMERFDYITSNNYNHAIELSEWKSSIERNWSNVKLSPEKSMNTLKQLKSTTNEKLTLSVSLYPAEINPSDLKVELYYGIVGHDNTLENPQTIEMEFIRKDSSGICYYSADFNLYEGGEYGYTFRVIPNYKYLINKFEMGLIKWVVQ